MGVKKIRIQRHDHFGFVESISCCYDGTECLPRRCLKVIVIEWLVLMPLRLRETSQHLLNLRRQSRRSDRLSQNPQTTAIPGVSLAQRTANVEQKGLPRA